MDSEDFEWIEIRNIGNRNVNTFEMSFPAGFPFERELRLSPSVSISRRLIEGWYGAQLDSQPR